MNSTARMVLKGSGLLIFTFLLVSRATGAGSLVDKAFQGSNTFAKTLQGR